MRIGLIDVDGTKFPNIALGKIAAYHRAQGDTVEWAVPLFGEYDRIYASKIFNFSPEITDVYNCEIIRGGTGYDVHSRLPEEIDRMQPDYSMYPDIDKRTAYGFLTRGCPNKCPWYVVPEKEGMIHPYMDVDEVAAGGRTNLILMDNNILACDYGIAQIEKIVDRRYRVDFNQAMDSRLVTDDIAALLTRVRWLKYVRFGCDTPGQIRTCEEAIERMRRHGFNCYFFLYCILTSVFQESFSRVNHWRLKRDWRVLPFAQPYRDPFPQAPALLNGNETSRDGSDDRRISRAATSKIISSAWISAAGNTSIPQWQKDMAHWVNRHQLYKSCDFKQFKPRKGFACSEYFKQSKEENNG